MVRATIVFWIIIAFVGTCWGQSQPAEPSGMTPVDRLLRAGYQALAERDFQQARDHFRLVLDLQPNHSRASRFLKACSDSLRVRTEELIAAGDRRFARGAFAEALINYHVAARLDSSRADIFSRIRLAGRRIYSRNYTLKALESYLQSDIPGTEQYLDSAAQFDPDYSLLPQFRQLLQTGPAEQVTKPQLQDDPEMWNLHLQALQHFRDGEFSDAIELWEQILKKYPNDPEIRASIYQAIYRWEASLPFLDETAER